MSKKSVLIVDDEKSIRQILEASLARSGFETLAVESGEEALEALANQSFSCVLTDVTMPGISGYELHDRIIESGYDTSVVIMTAYGTIPQAVEAIRKGAFEFITKPFDLDHVRKVVRAAVEEVPKSDSASTPSSSQASGVIAESPQMLALLETAKRAARSKSTILITGESGTGKEVLSKFIHANSDRAKHSFVAVSCAALPESLLEAELFGYEKGAFTGAEKSHQGRFEVADKGTLFLDEIGEIPMSTQVKLLRVLQERSFERLGSTDTINTDARLIAATNRSLNEAVENGQFRLDLMYRLQVIELQIPSLRDRKEDVVPLATHFISKFCAENNRPQMSLDDDAKAVLTSYAWPGNVRELENVIERAIVLSEAHSKALSGSDFDQIRTQAA